MLLMHWINPFEISRNPARSMYNSKRNFLRNVENRKITRSAMTCSAPAVQQLIKSSKLLKFAVCCERKLIKKLAYVFL